MELPTLTFRKELVINGLHTVHYYELSKHFTGPRQSFDAWELVYIDRGELLVTAGDEEFPMASGELILHAPGVHHCLRGNGTTAANVLTILFPCRSPILEGLGGRRLRPNTAQRAMLKDILRESRISFASRLDDPFDYTLVREKDAPIGSEQMIGAYMTELLVSLLRQIHRPQHVDKKTGSAPMLDAMVTYMEQNLSTKMSLELLSQEFHVSTSYIKRLFAQYKQMGAIKFFTTMKIEQAKKMLREREKNSSQIAEELGYDNIYYFCNQFKQFTGMSPMEYRKSVNAIGNFSTKFKRQEDYVMNRFNIHFTVKNQPVLDPDFMPISLFNKAFLETATKDVAFALERENGQVAVCRTKIHGTAEFEEADGYYADRLVKCMLWQKGGFKVYVTDEKLCNQLKAAYAPGGSRAFDADFMSTVYEQPFEVVLCEDVPEEKGASQAIGRHLGGCRIGFDAGGSDRKVSAVIDGNPVYSEETVWFPKITADPDYHYDGIVAALKAAAEKMPRVDAVGVSSAGIYIDNKTMVASLFLAVPKDQFKAKVQDIYIRAVRDTFGPDVPLVVANDGDVSALAGAMGLGENNVLGMAMGTSEAVGFVDAQGNITGWLNELAFMPVDANPEAMEDEWSGDIGCGVKYFSQDGVIKLAAKAGIELDESLSPAEKLKVVQGLMAQDDPAAANIYRSIGTYLGHSLAFYYDLYGCRHVLLLGRVMSGRGGDLILSECQRVLSDEYPECPVQPSLPDEKTRRVGQSAAAASLPEV